MCHFSDKYESKCRTCDGALVHVGWLLLLQQIIWIPHPPPYMELHPPVHALNIQDFCQGSRNNKKVWCVHQVSTGGCCSRNVIAEGTDRCEGLNLTCCKSRTLSHTLGWNSVCPCMLWLKPFVRRCWPLTWFSLHCPPLYTDFFCLVRLNLSLRLGGKPHVCVGAASRNCNVAAVLVMAGQLVWRVFRAGAVHCPLIASTMPLWADHTSTSHGPLSASVSAFLSVCHIYSTHSEVHSETWSAALSLTFAWKRQGQPVTSVNIRSGLALFQISHFTCLLPL